MHQKERVLSYSEPRIYKRRDQAHKHLISKTLNRVTNIDSTQETLYIYWLVN